MSSELTKTQGTALTNTKDFFARTDVKAKFEEMMGKRATQFITSVLQIVNSNELLKNADAASIYNAAATAATLDLPLNNNLGFAYIVPYKTKVKGENGNQDYWVNVAQFQMGYKGFIQLAQRSGQFKTISSAAIYEGQIVSENPLTGYEFDFKVKGEKVIGYAAYFKLINGYEATLYMTIEDLHKHGTKFSQTFKKGFGLWKDDFDGMAKKTVLKLLLSKYAPLSVEMQKAVVTDQSIINDENADSVTYVDNYEIQSSEVVSEEVENARIENFIKNATKQEQLDEVYPSVKDHQMDLFLEKKEELSKKK